MCRQRILRQSSACRRPIRTCPWHQQHLTRPGGKQDWPEREKLSCEAAPVTTSTIRAPRDAWPLYPKPYQSVTGWAWPWTRRLCRGAVPEGADCCRLSRPLGQHTLPNPLSPAGHRQTHCNATHIPKVGLLPSGLSDSWAPCAPSSLLFHRIP